MNTIKERFYAKTKRADNGCLEWAASLKDTGYGLFRIGKRYRLAHRVAWFIHYGVWPTLCVCHSCDNRKCVDIAHLWLGTQADNIRDRDRKGRGGTNNTYGEDRPYAKLTNAQVVEIRQLIEEGILQKDIAKQYNVDPSTISKIKTNTTRVKG